MTKLGNTREHQELDIVANGFEYAIKIAEYSAVFFRLFGFVEHVKKGFIVFIKQDDHAFAGFLTHFFN